MTRYRVKANPKFHAVLSDVDKPTPNLSEGDVVILDEEYSGNYSPNVSVGFYEGMAHSLILPEFLEEIMEDEVQKYRVSENYTPDACGIQPGDIVCIVMESEHDVEIVHCVSYDEWVENGGYSQTIDRKFLIPVNDNGDEIAENVEEKPTVNVTAKMVAAYLEAGNSAVELNESETIPVPELLIILCDYIDGRINADS